MNRVLLLAVCMAVTCASGCFVPYVYPSVCHLPPVGVNAPGRTATAFRVDVSERRSRFIGGFVSPTLAFTGSDDESATPRTASVHVNRGVMLYPVLHIGRNGYTCTKLYRRGYRTVVLEPWAEVGRVEWVECENAEEQFQAIRDLLFATPWHSAPIRLDSSEPAVNDEFPGDIHDRTGWTKDDGYPYTRFSPTVRPGSWSKEHREGLEFARDECEDLLKQPTVDEPLRKRIEYLMHRLDEVIER